MNKAITNKKRMMYISGEDFYFFTYNILIILKELKCVHGRTFKDYRKLPFMVDIISDHHLLEILSRNDFGEVKNPLDRKHLINSYTNCQITTPEYLKLLFSLEKKGYITLSSEKRNSQIDISLNKEKINKGFFEPHLFKKETDNISLLQSKVKRLSSMKYETLIDKIYTANRGLKWAS